MPIRGVYHLWCNIARIVAGTASRWFLRTARTGERIFLMLSITMFFFMSLSCWAEEKNNSLPVSGEVMRVIKDAIILESDLGPEGNFVENLSFGDRVTMAGQEVFAFGEAYVRVRTPGGKEGWVVKRTLTPDVTFSDEFVRSLRAASLRDATDCDSRLKALEGFWSNSGHTLSICVDELTVSYAGESYRIHNIKVDGPTIRLSISNPNDSTVLHLRRIGENKIQFRIGRDPEVFMERVPDALALESRVQAVWTVSGKGSRNKGVGLREVDFCGQRPTMRIFEYGRMWEEPIDRIIVLPTRFPGKQFYVLKTKNLIIRWVQLEFEIEKGSFKNPVILDEGFMDRRDCP